MSLLIRCSYVNATKNHMIGQEPGFQEAYTDHRGELFRSCRKEYGRCVSRMYRDKPDGGAEPIGWVFQGRDHYQERDGKSKDTYLREVWVEVKQVS